MADKPFVLPAWIPVEVSEALREAIEGKRTGHIEIHYKNGVVGHVAERRSRLVASRLPAGEKVVYCPVDGQVMTEHDYGNTYLCRCGAKRTRSQLEREVRDGPPPPRSA